MFNGIDSFIHLFNLHVVGGSIRYSIAIKGGRSFVTSPRQSGILYEVIHGIFSYLLVKAVSPSVVHRPTFMMFPNARLPRSAIVDRLFAVKEVTTRSAFEGECNFERTALLFRHRRLSTGTVTSTITVRGPATVEHPNRRSVIQSRAVARIVPTIYYHVNRARQFSAHRQRNVRFYVAVMLPNRYGHFTIQ